MRVELHQKLTISNDNSSSPSDLVHASGDQVFTDATTYPLGDGKTINVAASAADQQLNLDGVTSAAIIMIRSEGAAVSVKLVPTGGSLGATPALKLLQNVPLTLGSDIMAVYFSNADTLNAAKVHVGYAGT